MRPYSFRKDDPKYIQPMINNTTGSQPSPLALLAATCSRIGDTFQEDNTIFAHKNFVIEKSIDDITTLKSCVDIRSDNFICSDVQTSTSLCQRTGIQYLNNSSCLKIKTEEAFDYNHNCEGFHSCSNGISDTRMLEHQARTSFTKSCDRGFPHSSSCGHNQQQQQQQQQQQDDGVFNFNIETSCEHEMSGQVDLSANNSCAFQGNQPSTTQQPACALENVSLPASDLSHVQPITQSLNYNALENYHRQKQQQTNWHANSQQHCERTHSIQVDKSTYLQHETFSTQNSPVQVNCPQNSSYSRHYRHSLSHMGSPTEESYVRAHHHGNISSQPRNIISQEQYYHSSMNTNSTSPHGYSYSPFPSMDVKQEPYNHASHQSAIPSEYSATPQQMMQLPPTPQPQQTLPSHLNMSPVHNHPAGMTSNFCHVCNSQSTNAYISDIVGGVNGSGVGVQPSMVGNMDMQSQSLAEYQYQQQQMLYARDNRRPRRVACTCPNCRDGENKTVTTKDGKQRKLHVCHIPGCGKIYGKTSHLRAHLRWHAGERPFACNWLFCNKRFTRSDELQRHRRTHTGDKRFECNVCLKKFMRSDHLSKHMKTHQSQKQKDKSDSNVTAAGKDRTTGETLTDNSLEEIK